MTYRPRSPNRVREHSTAWRVEPSGPLSYTALLGFKSEAILKVVDQVTHGFAYQAFFRFQHNTGFSASALAELARIPLRTLQRRKAGGRFSPEESDRLLRASRIVALALDLFEGEMTAARLWLETPLMALGGSTPLKLASTEIGAREVEHLIGRIEHGVPV